MISRRVAFETLLLAAGLALLVLLKDVLIVIFLGLLVGVVFSFPIGWFSHVMPRGIALLLTLILLLGGAAGLGWATYSPLQEQVTQLETQMPRAIDKAREWFQKEQRQSPLGGNTQGAIPGLPSPSKAGQPSFDFMAAVRNAGQAVMSITWLFATVIIVIVLAAFFSHSPSTYHEGVLALVPRESEESVDQLWHKLGTGLRHWVGGMLISMTIMGVMAAVGLAIAGVQDWFLLGTLTFIATSVPYLGAITSAIPGLLLASTQSVGTLIGAGVVYLAVHATEGYLVSPLIMRRAVVIRPAALLSWQLVMMAVAGIPGIIVATPLLVCVKIIVGHFYIEGTLGKRPASV